MEAGPAWDEAAGPDGPSPRAVVRLLVRQGESARQTFERLDVNGDGFVSLDELCAAGVPRGVAALLVGMADSDEDGRIALAEFHTLWHIQSEVDDLKAQLGVGDDGSGAAPAPAPAPASPLPQQPSYQMAQWSFQEWTGLAQDFSGFSDAPESNKSSNRGHEIETKTWRGVSQILDLANRAVANSPPDKPGPVEFQPVAAEDLRFPRGKGA